MSRLGGRAAVHHVCLAARVVVRAFVSRVPPLLRCGLRPLSGSEALSSNSALVRARRPDARYTGAKGAPDILLHYNYYAPPHEAQPPPMGVLRIADEVCR